MIGHQLRQRSCAARQSLASLLGGEKPRTGKKAERSIERSCWVVTIRDGAVGGDDALGFAHLHQRTNRSIPSVPGVGQRVRWVLNTKRSHTRSFPRAREGSRARTNRSDWTGGRGACQEERSKTVTGCLLSDDPDLDDPEALGRIIDQ